MLIPKRSSYSRTYWISTTCSHDTYQEPHILYQRMIQSHHQQQCSEQYALQSVAASCCCYAFAPDTSSRFVSWSISSCFRKHFANLVGALFAFASIKCYAKFSSGMVAAYFFIGQHGFHFFLQSTRVNDRFLWNQDILAIGRIVRVNVKVFIVYTHVHIYSTYDTTATTNSSVTAACWWYTASSDYCCMLLLLLYDRLCVQIFTDNDVRTTSM